MSFLFLKATTLVVQTVKNLPAMWETGFDPWIEKIPWKREWLPIPVFLPRKFHGQRLHSPWGHKGSDTTQPLTLSLHSRNRVIYIHIYTYPKTMLVKQKTNFKKSQKSPGVIVPDFLPFLSVLIWGDYPGCPHPTHMLSGWWGKARIRHGASQD